MELLRYFLLANLLIAVLSGAFYGLLRRETSFNANRLTLWLGLIAALALPWLELPDWRPQPVRAAMQRTAQLITPGAQPDPAVQSPQVVITYPDGRTYPAFNSSITADNWPWLTWLGFGYGFVVLLLLVRFGRQLTSLMKLLRHTFREEYDGFTLIHAENDTAPFSFFGWVVLNPHQHDPDELEQILRHERVHVRARHSLDMVAAELLCIVFWINPAVYLFRRLLHQTLEFAADRAVLNEGVEAKAYQYSLLKVNLTTGQSA